MNARCAHAAKTAQHSMRAAAARTARQLGLAVFARSALRAPESEPSVGAAAALWAISQQPPVGTPAALDTTRLEASMRAAAADDARCAKRTMATTIADNTPLPHEPMAASIALAAIPPSQAVWARPANVATLACTTVPTTLDPPSAGLQDLASANPGREGVFQLPTPDVQPRSTRQLRHPVLWTAVRTHAVRLPFSKGWIQERPALLAKTCHWR